MMRQYRMVKEAHHDCILMFRLGDFYEMFMDDAVRASGILDITLTSREAGKGNRMPMCGVPYHAVEGYVAKLIRAGCKVAICDQVEDPKLAQGIVKRQVTRIISPGTLLDGTVERLTGNNYLASINRQDGVCGFSYIDLSTGEFKVTELVDEEQLIDEIARVSPAECLIPRSLADEGGIEQSLRKTCAAIIDERDDWDYDYDSSYRLLREQFGTQSLDGFGLAELGPGVGAAGAILSYLHENLYERLDHVGSISIYSAEDFMILDSISRRNLEIVTATRSGGKEGTLVSVLDRTVTPMGGRLIRHWLFQPLLDPAAITFRLDGVEELVETPAALGRVRERLRGMRDIQRLLSRLSCGYATARDLAGLRESLKLVPALREAVSTAACEILRKVHEDLHGEDTVVELLERAIVDGPPVSVRDGGMIRDGYSRELDELRSVSRDGKSWIANLQRKEIERTGIKSLKVGYNKVFGYYLEITKANLARAPEDYIRKQTLVNAERFVTPELKEYEAKVLGAQEKIAELEYDIFMGVKDSVVSSSRHLQRIAGAISLLDVLSSLAYTAIHNDYVRPVVDGSDSIEVRGGRHPVIEQMVDHFVPNDTCLDTETNQLLIITGPNMAGKSTYIRQVALIVLMAQAGSFVPADSARIGAVDRIFTRVGASDEIARGQSTFMVEMNETANILNNATERSLIVLDEIGRGTSTFDGISIAWAVAEYIHNTPSIRARTLFATHYHELTELEMDLPGVRNYNIAVKEWNEEIVFLRKIVPGGTDKSYGIHVARLAGLPEKVIERAKDILNCLEEGAIRESDLPSENAPVSPDLQLSLFDTRSHIIIEELKSINPEELTPVEALIKLKELKDKVDKS